MPRQDVPGAGGGRLGRAGVTWCAPIGPGGLGVLGIEIGRALRADAVRELGLRAIAQVRLHLAPVALVVADLLHDVLVGGRDAMRKGSWIIRPVTVSIRVGRPIETAGLPPDQRDELIGRVRKEIEALVAEGPIRE